MRGGDSLLTEKDARRLIGCARRKLWDWIQDGRLFAIDISCSDGGRPTYRIGNASAMAMQKVCNRQA